jgi:hypothetical protein
MEEWAKHGKLVRVCRLREPPDAYRLLAGRRRWKDNINMDVKEIEWVDVDWIHLAQNRNKWRTVANTVMNFQAQ